LYFLKFGFFYFCLSFALFASNLNELIALSAQNEEYLKAELEHLKAASKRSQAFREYLPELSLNANYLANNKDRFITDPKESLFASLSLKFLVFDFFKRENTLRALENAQDLALVAKNYSKNYLALKACILYFNYQSLQSLIKASTQKKKALKQSLKRLEAFYKVGLSAQEDLEAVRAKFYLADLELAQNELKLAQIARDIKLLSKQDFTPNARASLSEPENLNESKNYELLMTQSKIFLAQNELNAARAEYFPKIFIQNRFTSYKNHFDIEVPQAFRPIAGEFSQTYFPKHSNTNQFLLGFEWKIFDFNARNKAVEQKRLDLQIAKLENAYKKRELALNLEQNYDELKLLKRQIKALEQAFKASNLAFLSVEKKFQSQLASYNDYLLALESKFKAQSDLEFALNEFEISKAKLYFLAAVSIEERIKP